MSENSDVHYSIRDENRAKLTPTNKIRLHRTSAVGISFAIDAAGDISLIQPLKPDVHYYEIVVIGQNIAPGPIGEVTIRFYPISDQNTARVQTQNFGDFDEETFATELSSLYGQDASVIINDITMVSDDSGTTTNQVYYRY